MLEVINVSHQFILVIIHLLPQSFCVDLEIVHLGRYGFQGGWSLNVAQGATWGHGSVCVKMMAFGQL